MFFIVWRGWGILVPVFVVVGFAVVLAVVNAVFPAAAPQHALATQIAWPVAGLLTGLAIWFVALKIEGGGDQRTLVDEASGQRFVIKPSAGSLFFIPTKYWAFIVFALSIWLGLSPALRTVS